MFENPRRGRQAKTFTTTVPKILDLKSSSEQIFSENCRWVPLVFLSITVVPGEIEDNAYAKLTVTWDYTPYLTFCTRGFFPRATRSFVGRMETHTSSAKDTKDLSETGNRA